MRIYLPLEIIKDNPYQTRRDYGDIETFAAEEILPFYPQRAATLGLQTPPHARLMHGDLPLSEAQLATIASAASTLPAEDEVAAVREVWASVRVELVFGHRRVRALKLLHYEARAAQSMAAKKPMQLKGSEDFMMNLHAFSTKNIFKDPDRDPTPAATIAAYALGFVPVDVVQLADVDMLREVHMENAGRKNPAAMEELPYLEHALKILESEGKEATVTAAAKLLGMSRSRAANLWRLRDIDPELAAANVRGELSQSQLEELLIVQRIAELVKGRELPKHRFSKDNINMDSTWQLPYPDRLLDLVREHNYSRTELRKYIGNVVDAVGIRVVELIATTPTTSGRAATCASCPAFVREHCLFSPCYETRSREILQSVAAAKFPGVRWSDDEADFPDKAWQCDDLAAHLATLASPAADSHVVIGRIKKDYGVRPFHDRNYLAEDTGQRDPLKQLSFGYVGKIPKVKKEAAAPSADTFEYKRQRAERYEKHASSVGEWARNQVVERVVDTYVPRVNREMLDVVVDLTKHWVEFEADDSDVQKLRKIINKQVPNRVDALRTYVALPEPRPAISNADKACMLLGEYLPYERTWMATHFPILVREWMLELIGDTDLDAEMQADIWDLAVGLGFADEDDKAEDFAVWHGSGVDDDTVELDGELDARAAVELEA